ncbi:hypothetical protein [Nocardia abscessus]|nr:hypothetical protein [Nocardia abscessus]
MSEDLGKDDGRYIGRGGAAHRPRPGRAGAMMGSVIVAESREAGC